MSRIVLAAGSVADDLGYVALADISGALGRQTTDYRIIGGLMMTALAARSDLGASLYRETLDADLGVPPIVPRPRHRRPTQGNRLPAGRRRQVRETRARHSGRSLRPCPGSIPRRHRRPRARLHEPGQAERQSGRRWEPTPGDIRRRPARNIRLPQWLSALVSKFGKSFLPVGMARFEPAVSCSQISSGPPLD